jgi:benzoyl-CoA 2,3-dioxygenase component B
VLRLKDGMMVSENAPALSALNMRLRDDYLKDCSLGIGRWNKVIDGTGVKFALKLPHQAFHRHIGEFSAIHADPDGNVLNDAEWEKRKADYLPSDSDRVYIESLMQPVIEPGRFASWIAPPKVGIDNKPGDFEYVKLA